MQCHQPSGSPDSCGRPNSPCPLSFWSQVVLAGLLSYVPWFMQGGE